MSIVLENIKKKAAALKKTIVLPESDDVRVVKAAEMVTAEKLAKVVLIGNASEIKLRCPDVSLEGIEIVDPNTSEKANQYAELLYSLRKNKGMTIEEANNLIFDPIYWAVLMVKNGDADGMVAGANHATSDVLRPALKVIKTAKGINTVSSCFIMIMPSDKVYIYSDCGVVIEPDAEQLKDIAIASAKSMKSLIGEEPKVAMLSFSTKGSARHASIDKVAKATALVMETAPDILIDGELQVDAAIVPSVQKLKAPNSPLKGDANVFIFPDINAGNIGYKLTQRLAGAIAIGPICQGMAAPVNDLSRGCTSDDVVSAVAITILQTQ